LLFFQDIDCTASPPGKMTRFSSIKTAPNDLAIRRAFELAGVEFIDENGRGPGVRLRKRYQKKR
jgi:hypothetical protein